MLRKYFTPVVKVLKEYCQYSCKPGSPYVPPFYCTVFSNGVRVIVEQTFSPYTCISLFAEAGPRFEVACNNGVTHFIEHMADKGILSAPSIRKAAFHQHLLEMGANMTVNTSREIQSFTVTCPNERIQCLMSYLAHIVTALDSDPQDLEAERNVIFEELIDLEKDPKAVVFDYLHQSAFQGTPMSQRVIGPSANIQCFSEYFLNTYLAEHYQPYRFVLAVSGPTPIDQVIFSANTCFGGLESTSAQQEYGPCRYTGSSVMYRDDSMPFLHMAIAVEAPGYPTHEYLEMKLLTHLMGRWDKSIGGGYKAWPALAQASSISDLCVSYQPFYLAYRDIGLWGIYTVSTALDIEDMLYNIQDKWMQLCVTILHADMERAKAAYKLELAMNVDGSINSCRDMALQMMYKCNRDSYVDIYDSLSHLKLENLKATAEKYIYNRCPVVVGVGPTEGIPEYNRIRNGMYWLRV